MTTTPTSMIRTVLAPLDFSASSEREISLAADVARLFRARLVLHHNLGAAPMGLSRAWDWDGTHQEARGSEATVEEEIRRVLDRLPPDLSAQAHVSRGLVLPVLLGLIRAIPIDLVVLASHGRSRDDHSSVGERIIRQAPCPVLAFHHEEGETDDGEDRLRFPEDRRLEVLVPLGVSEGARRVAAYAFELARRIPARLHLLHVLPPESPPVMKPVDHVLGRPRTSGGPEEARARILTWIPADLEARTEVDVRSGFPEDEILAAARRLEADFVVMGEHCRKLLRGFLTRDVAREVLHRAPCPVWFVPPGARLAVPPRRPLEPGVSRRVREAAPTP